MLAGATIAVLLVVGLSAPAHADATLQNWVSAFCDKAHYYFSFANTQPAVAAGDDAPLAVRRYLGELTTRTIGLQMTDMTGLPPVASAKQLRSKYERQLDHAVDEFQLAGGFLKKPRVTAARIQAVVRHLGSGYDDVVAAMRQLHGNTGNARFDAAMLAEKGCDFIPQLTTIGPAAEA